MDKCRELFENGRVNWNFKRKGDKYWFKAVQSAWEHHIEIWNASHDRCIELCHSLLVQDKPIPVNDDKWNVGLTAAAIAIRKDKVKL